MTLSLFLCMAGLSVSDADEGEKIGSTLTLSEPSYVQFVEASAESSREEARGVLSPESEKFAKDPDADIGESSGEDLAKKAQNPLADIISMPLQWNTDFGIGPHDREASVLNIQPIYPVDLGEGRTLINRMIAPLPKYVPDAAQSSGSETGLGDIILMNWYTPAPKGKFMWGAGSVTVWPTASDDKLGDDKFSIGPSAVLVYMDPQFIAASVIQAWWSVGGDSDAPDVGIFYWQPIVSYFLPERWYLITAPVILADLEADSGQKWIVPLGGGIGKMFNWGKLPMDLTTQAYSYIEAPDGGPDWMFRLQLKFIFPKKK